MGSIPGRHGHTDARGCVDDPSRQIDIAAQLVEHIGHDALEHYVVFNVRNHDHDIISAEPCHHVGFTHARAYAPGNLGQQLVADLVPERVVDVLEAIQIDQHHGA